MKKHKLCVLFIGLAMILSSCQYFIPVETKINAPSLMPSKKIVLPTTEVKQGDIVNAIEKDAVFQPDLTKIVSLGFPVTGTIDEVYVKTGQFVKEGQLLMSLDTKEIDASIFYQKITIKKLELRKEHDQILLFTKKTDEYVLKIDELALEQARNHLKDLDIIYRQHYLHSSGEGTVLSIAGTKGDRASRSMIEICNKNDGVAFFSTHLNSSTPEEDNILAFLKPGAVFILIHKGNSFQGTLFRDSVAYTIATGISNNEETFYELKFDILPDDMIFGEMTGARYIKEASYDTLYLPLSCVYQEAELHFVYKVTGNEMQKTYVETGVTDGVFVEIRSGISLGDLILKVK